ncbi:MAG: hypothetical protein GJT30_14335 [Geobacter sp.]|nr:hypothetical protein [Geobacter sp.]
MKRIIPIAGILTMALMSQGCGSGASAPVVSTKQVFVSFSTNATPVAGPSGVEFDVILPENVTVPLKAGTTNEVSVTALTTANRLSASLSILASYTSLPTTPPTKKVHIAALDISGTPTTINYGKFLTLTCTYASTLQATDITSLNPAGSLNFIGTYNNVNPDITTILSEPQLSISITN